VTDNSRLAALLSALDRERADFLSALDELDPNAARRPLVGDWNARDLTHHVAYWCDHGADALALAAEARGDEFAYSRHQTDGMNAEAAAAGRRLTLDQARAEEGAAFGRFRRAVAALSEANLDQQLGNGDRVESVIRYDGPDHYAEHAAHLRARRP
jgi:DinB superfamily